MPKAKRRNRGFDETHQEMIETAVSLISEQGVASLSIAAIARAMGIDRTTVYYHFDSREALVRAVRKWSAEQLAKAFDLDAPQQDRIDYISRFVLENPELIKLWIEDFVSPGDIRGRYPYWDALVSGIRKTAGKKDIDAEVFSTIMMTSAIIGPRVFRNSVSPGESTEAIVRRFRQEWQRILKYAGLLRQ